MSDQNEQPTGLPQSALGGLHPELRAHITAASAALGDFRAEDKAYQDSGSMERRPDYVSWVYRLDAELGAVLDAIERLSK